ncbi:hypothetical protein [Sphingomonas morindae]|uniref:DUF3168 domain-containing protein n=1 Tax=Sphingomonas morindae TaxID=1541170 RepID=A0ABY4X3Y0_9SPHN|nr:hypothetical protein [Sphingomonas morindae]USI71618.1 hypothetical protein LHA26_09740 [Sphingomonas morindae]
MTPLREQIWAEIERRLGAIDGVAEVEREPSAEPISFNALHLEDAGQRTIDGSAGATWYQLAVTIRGYVEGGAGAEAHAALNQLHADTVAALMADEPPLGGLAETIDEGAMQVQVATAASERRLMFLLDLELTFATRRGNPAQPA